MFEKEVYAWKEIILPRGIKENEIGGYQPNGQQKIKLSEVSNLLCLLF